MRILEWIAFPSPKYIYIYIGRERERLFSKLKSFNYENGIYVHKSIKIGRISLSKVQFALRVYYQQ